MKKLALGLIFCLMIFLAPVFDVWIQETAVATNNLTYPDNMAPTINIIKPTVVETSNPSVDFEAEISDEVTDSEDLEASLRSPEYTIPEGQLTIASDGTVTAVIPLREGQNQITISVRDEAGNLATESLTVERTIPTTTGFWDIIAYFFPLIKFL